MYSSSCYSGNSIDSYCNSCGSMNNTGYQSVDFQSVDFNSSIDYCVSAKPSSYNISVQPSSYLNQSSSSQQPSYSIVNSTASPVYSANNSSSVYSAASNGDPYKNVKMPGMSHNISVDIFDPESFLTRHRMPTIFIGKADQIKHYVKECFEKTLGEKLPDNIIIRICEKDELKQIHEKFDGRWVEGIVGFAINRNKKNAINEIFVKQDSLDKILITIGHEIGHVLGARLQGKKEEEKAFAFELAWLDTIKQHNIAGIGRNIIQINPAKNNFHDLAFEFVINLVRNGMRAIDVFRELVCSGF